MTRSSGSTASSDPTFPGSPTPPAVLWVSAVVAALVAAGVVLLVPQIPTDGDDRVGRAAGVHELGSAPGSDGTGSAPEGVPTAGTPAEPGAVTPPGGMVDQPGVAVSPGVVVGQPGVVVQPADLTATYAIDARGDLLSVRFYVTISNAGAATGEWGAVVMDLSGLNLIVTMGYGVGHEIRNRHHVFAPLTPEFATVPAYAAVAWTFIVTGVLTGVASCALDGKACISPAPA